MVGSRVCQHTREMKRLVGLGGVEIRSVVWSPHCDAHELGTFPPRTYHPLKCVPVGHLRKTHGVGARLPTACGLFSDFAIVT